MTSGNTDSEGQDRTAETAGVEPNGGEPPRFMTVKQAAAYLQVNEKKIYALVREGKILYAGSSNFAALHIAQAQCAAGQRNFMGLVCRYLQHPCQVAVQDENMQLVPGGVVCLVDAGDLERGTGDFSVVILKGQYDL